MTDVGFANGVFLTGFFDPILNILATNNQGAIKFPVV